jgi:hypothetical protein
MKIVRWLGAAALVGLAAVLMGSCKPKAAVPDSFLKLAPRESFLYANARDLKAWRDTTKAFDFITAARRLKLPSRLQALLVSELEAEGPVPAAPQTIARELRKIRGKAKLWEIFGNEVALFAFPTEKSIKPALVAVCRLPAGAGAEYQGYFEEAVNALLKGRKTAVSRSQFLEETLSSVVLVRNDVSLAPTWAQVGDVLILSSRPEGAREMVARLKGRGGKYSLSDDSSFRRAMKGLDPSAMGVWYARSDGLLDWALRIYKFQKRRLDGELKNDGIAGGLESAEAHQARYYLRLITRAAKAVDLVGGSGNLERGGWGETSRIYLNPQEGSNALKEMLQTPPREHEVLRLLPAKSVSVSAGFISPEKLYRLFVDYVIKNPAHGKKAAKRWQAAQTEAGIDVSDDILSALGDEYGLAMVSFGKSMFDSNSFALAWKAKGREEGERAIGKLVAAIRAKASSGHWSFLNFGDEEYEGIKMSVCYLPLPIMGLTPTLGAVDGYIVLASGKDVFKTVVDIAKKREKSIREDSDFRRLAKRTGDRGTSISFSRVAEQFDSAASLIRSVSSLFGMGALMGKPQTPEEEKELKKTQETISLLNDLARAVETLKAYKFNASSWAFNGACVEMKDYTEIEMKEGK